jgi:hypothetical protein
MISAGRQYRFGGLWKFKVRKIRTLLIAERCHVGGAFNIGWIILRC